MPLSVVEESYLRLWPGNRSKCFMCYVDFPAYVFHGCFHSEVRIKGETQVFEGERFLERESLRGL